MRTKIRAETRSLPAGRANHRGQHRVRRAPTRRARSHVTITVDGEQVADGRRPDQRPAAVHRQRLPRHRHLPRLARLPGLLRPRPVPVQRPHRHHARRLHLTGPVQRRRPHTVADHAASPKRPPRRHRLPPGTARRLATRQCCEQFEHRLGAGPRGNADPSRPEAAPSPKLADRSARSHRPCDPRPRVRPIAESQSGGVDGGSRRETSRSPTRRIAARPDLVAPTMRFKDIGYPLEHRSYFGLRGASGALLTTVPFGPNERGGSPGSAGVQPCCLALHNLERLHHNYFHGWFEVRQ